MVVGMSIGSLSRPPPSSNSLKTHEDFYFLRASTFISQSRGFGFVGHEKNSNMTRRLHLMVVEAKGKRGMQPGQFQRPPPLPLPKLEDDGNPKFVIFMRTANVYLWYPLSLISGGTTAKIMVAAKDNFLGKYIYKDTIARNLAAVIYRDEKKIQQSAIKQYWVLRSATAFRYGYKLVEKNNVRAALSPTDVIELPPQEELKTVLDKVKDFFGEATSGVKESFGKLTDLNAMGRLKADENWPVVLDNVFQNSFFRGSFEGCKWHIRTM